MNPIDLEALPDAIRSCVTSGKAVVENMNRAFLKSSEFLEAVVEESAIMESESKEIIQMVTWADGSEDQFNHLTDEIKKSLDTCSEVIQGLHSHSEKVMATGEMISRFIDLQKKLMATLEPLKTMRTFFLVSISKIPSDKQKAMLGVVSDMESLYEQAQQVTTQELQAMRSLQDQLDLEKEKIESSMIHLNSNIGEENVRIQNTLEGMQADLRKNRHISVQLESITHEIAALVSESVTAIQSDDIAGQKVQHIFEAVDVILDKLKEWKNEGYSRDKEETAFYLISSARIQKKQIDSVLSDYKHSSEKVDQIYPSIREKIRHLDTECLSLKEYSTLTTSADGAIQVLLEALDTTQRLFSETQSALDSLNSLLNPLAQISSESADAVDGVTIDLRVVTVNARIMASRVGAQSGLTPLTENVGQISMESKQYSNLLTDDLHEFVRSIAKLTDGLGEVSKALETAKDTFVEIELTGRKELHAFRDKALDHLNVLSKNAELIESNISSHEDAVNQAECIEYFSSLADLMETIDLSVQSHFETPLNFDEMDVSIVSDLKEKYTMHSERENHESAFDDSSSESSASTGVDDEFILF